MAVLIQLLLSGAAVKLRQSRTTAKQAKRNYADSRLNIADFLIKQDWRLFRNNNKNLSESHLVEYDEKELSPPTNEELTKLAENLIGYNNRIGKAEIPFFEEMLKFKIIKESKPVLGNYYLSCSTPF